jgi:hypothetical protein
MRLVPQLDVLPRRWVAARTFAWLTRYRRLVRICERKPEHHQALIWWATVHQMIRRLASAVTAQPPPGRRADPPPLPDLSSPDRRGKVPQTPDRPALTGQEKGPSWPPSWAIENVNSFRIQLSPWSHQGHINKIGPALYGPMPTSTQAFRQQALRGSRPQRARASSSGSKRRRQAMPVESGRHRRYRR